MMGKRWLPELEGLAPQKALYFNVWQFLDGKYDTCSFVCLFDLILYLPVNNLSVTSGQVLKKRILGWTSTKLGFKYDSFIVLDSE